MNDQLIIKIWPLCGTHLRSGIQNKKKKAIFHYFTKENCDTKIKKKIKTKIKTMNSLMQQTIGY